MGKFAWVTLATNDSYSMGALVLAHSLRRVNTAHQLVILVTPGVTEAMKTQLSAVFNVVKLVDVLDSRDADNLALLARPELGITFTKLHCWKLTEYEKCVFLDADTLVLQNSDELFEREELSAAPDAGWPDCFNSGVFVYKPSQETFKALIEFALIHGSFDGGDQGLLNLYFSDWPTKDIQKHLPFIYNMCATATYSYLPAFKQFGAGLKIIHFIGATKPWLQPFNTETGLVSVSGDSQHTTQFVQLWWDIFCAHVHPSLSTEMAGLAAALATVTLGAPISVEQRALEEHLRRQGWEQGNIDYMGKDSFANIWNKICETMGTPAPPGGLALGIPMPSGGVPEPPSPAPVAPVAAPVYVSSVEISSSGQIDKTPPQPIYAPVSAILPTVESSDTKVATKVPVSESSTVVPEQKPSVAEVVTTETSVTPSVTLETSTPAPQLPSEPPAAQQPPLEPTVKTDSAAAVTEVSVSPAATPAAKEEAIVPPVAAPPVAEPFTSTPPAQPPTDALAPTPLPIDAPVPTVPSVIPLPIEAAASTTPIQTPVPTHVPVSTTAAPTAAPIATTVPTAAPVPTEPVPTAAPVTTEPVPTAATEPVPTAAPVPTEPVPTEPVPTEPVPTAAPVTTEPVPTAAPVSTTQAAAPTEPPVPTLPPTETPVSAPSDSALPTPPVLPPTPSAPAPGNVPAPALAKAEPAQPQTPTVTGPTPPLSPAAAADVPQIAKLQVEADIPATPPVGASPQPLEGAVGEDPPVPPKRKGGSKAPQDPKNQKGGKPQPKGKK